ncbi:monooxygenase [Mycobacterium bourgelatii]|uniref:Monooxygenase n=2 Tax=Mycobacterium bourgelatii TaxID=1273442 RepID=A0A7I9YIB4_MYCBU|nr:monooxygenase [Mycobacterium bourgelatii]
MAVAIFKRGSAMTLTPQAGPEADFVDVVIVGAGISGIGAAYRLTERNPNLTYTILERRAQIGGTWDLFRYPGVRSDSSIFTLSFPFEPWTRKEGVADGEHIREYLTTTAHKYGIDRHIRFNSYVRSANWDSSTDTWTITCEEDGSTKLYRSRFVFFGSGYYNYDEGYTPEFPGIDEFGGTVIHPQHWPEDLDYTGKKVVVIGSGATAVTLIPAMADRAAKVTMLQRSPTYMISASKYSKVAAVARTLLPRKASHLVIRTYNALGEAVLWFLSRKIPLFIKWLLRRVAIKNLPAGYDIDTHFKPRYNPWDQRMCLIPDADLYTVVAEGRADVVTDHIDHFDETGIALKSGKHLDADIIVTATGLQLQALGGVKVSLDGVEIDTRDRFVYKAHMLEDVPNLFWCVGYTNASWTLRADITARATAKLLAHMAAHGYTHAYPHLGDEPMAEKPSWDIQAGYVLRNLHALPKSGTKRPWNVRQNYFADAIDYRFDRVDEAMVFGRVSERAALAG